MERSRGFCFTSFDVEHKPAYDPETMRFLIFQREACPSTESNGREHWQGYVHFKLQVRKKDVASRLSLGAAHAEPRRGSIGAAVNYCRKARTSVSAPEEYGEIPQPGTRTDLRQFTDGLRAGRSIRELAFEYPTVFVRASRGLREFQQMVRPPFRDDIHVHYFHGEAGIGKSRHVWSLLREAYERDDVYVAKDSPQGWFDGYAGQSTVYFEDFGGLFPLKEMLQLIDRYPCSQWIKGSCVPIYATKFYFTANRPPECFYGADPAWLRRLTNVVAVTGGRGGSAPPVEEL